MLKITTQIEEGVMTFGVEGKLAGAWVKELERHWRTVASSQPTRRMRVDVSSATFIDEEGKDLLRTMHREGAQLVATGCLNMSIVEEIMRSKKSDGPLST